MIEDNLYIIEVNNRDYRSWYGLGQAYEVMKYTSDAIYYYQKATDLRPQDGRMWKALASCYSTLKQDKEAENYNRRAEACDRRSNKSEMIQIARIFERRGKMGVAIDFYQEVWQRAVASVNTLRYIYMCVFEIKGLIFCYNRIQLMNKLQIFAFY